MAVKVRQRVFLFIFSHVAALAEQMAVLVSPYANLKNQSSNFGSIVIRFLKKKKWKKKKFVFWIQLLSLFFSRLMLYFLTLFFFRHSCSFMCIHSCMTGMFFYLSWPGSGKETSHASMMYPYTSVLDISLAAFPLWIKWHGGINIQHHFAQGKPHAATEIAADFILHAVL